MPKLWTSWVLVFLSYFHGTLKNTWSFLYFVNYKMSHLTELKILFSTKVFFKMLRFLFHWHSQKSDRGYWWHWFLGITLSTRGSSYVVLRTLKFSSYLNSGWGMKIWGDCQSFVPSIQAISILVQVKGHNNLWTILYFPNWLDMYHK